MPTLPTDYIVLDFETGGFLGSPNGRPIETGLLMFKDGRAQIRSVLTDPRKGDQPDFIVEPGAYQAHGIDLDLLAEQGVPIRDGLAEIRRLLGEDLAIVGHNETGFDRPLLNRELARYGLPPVAESRWYDTAALYKGWKMGEPFFDNETPQAYSKRILSTFRKGLLFRIGYLVARLPLGIWMTDDLNERVTDPDQVEHASGVGISPDLGLTDKELDFIMDLGFHRAPFDCAATHAIMQWALKHTDGFFDD